MRIISMAEIKNTGDEIYDEAVGEIYEKQCDYIEVQRKFTRAFTILL